MSVYIDTLFDWGWKYGKSCHLFADTEKELHEFAQSIELKRSWFQISNNNMPHYDLTEKKRALAISKGAIEIDKYLFVKMIRQHRMNQQAVKP